MEKGEVVYLYLKVVEAEGIKASDLNGLADPYAVVKLRGRDGSETCTGFSTPVVSRSLNPMWNAISKIEFDPGVHQDLVVEVWDRDWIVDDWLGKFVVEDFSEKKTFDGWVEVEQRKDDKGRIHLSWVIDELNTVQFAAVYKADLPEGRPFPKPHHKIAILGAGPAGIHMAHLLKKQGYHNTTILEKEHHIGGKSYSITSLDSAGKEILHEIGTCFLNPTYHEVDLLNKDYDTPLVTEIDPGCEFCGDRDIYVRGVVLKRDEYIYKEAEKKVLPPRFWVLPDALQMSTIFLHIRRYVSIHRSIFGTYDYTLPPKPSPKALSLMNMTLKEFLIKNQVEALIPIFMLGHVAQGYGLLETTPAYYGLVWFNPELLLAYLPSPFGCNPRGTQLLTVLKEGFQQIWKEIHERDKLNVLLKREVTSIKRTDQEVILTIKNIQDGTQTELKFDYLIITTPLKQSLNIFQDPTPEETNIFSKLSPAKLNVTLYESDHQSNDHVIQYYLEEIDHNAVYGQRHSLRCLHSSLGRPCPTTTDRHVYVAYQYVERDQNLTQEQLQLIFYKDMEKRQIKNVKILYTHLWDYFYRFDNEEIMKGYPWEILKMQGNRRTMYAGASACFESVRDVLSYNRLLVDLFLSQKKD